METGEDLADRIEDTGGSAVWAARGNGFFYTRLDSNHRPSRVYFHRLGSDPADDSLVYEETDSGFFMGVGKTQSGDYIVIDIHDHETSEAWIAPANNPAAEPRLLAERETGIEYDVDEGDGTLYILTNADGAEDFKIVTASTDSTRRAEWSDYVPHEPGRLILGAHDPEAASRLAGASQRPAADRRQASRRRRRARHRLRGGGLFAGPRRHLRIRHHHDPLHLFLADDADARPSTTTSRAESERS